MTRTHTLDDHLTHLRDMTDKAQRGVGSVKRAVLEKRSNKLRELILAVFEDADLDKLDLRTTELIPIPREE